MSLQPSATNGYNFDILFYDCKENTDCTSLQFHVWFTKETFFGPELANKWNVSKRFLAMAFDPKDSTISVRYDISTVGGLNQVQFADTVDWWEAMLGEFDKFIDENKPAVKAKK